MELPPEVPEGVEPVPVLVLVWDPDPDPEPVEPPGLLELVAAGGAAQKKARENWLRNPSKRTLRELTAGGLDFEARPSRVNLRRVGWVNELDGVTGSGLQGNIGDGETLRPTVNITQDPQEEKNASASALLAYLLGDIDIFVDGERAIENGRV